MEEKEANETKKEDKKKPEINKEVNIQALVESYPESVPVLMENGFHCIGCVAARFETLEQGCSAHAIDVKKLVEDIKKVIKNEGKKKK